MDGFERLIHQIFEEDDGMCIITVYDSEEQDGDGMTGYYKLIEKYEIGDPVYKTELYDFKDGDLIPTGIKLDIDVKHAVISNIIKDEEGYEESEEVPVEDDE